MCQHHPDCPRADAPDAAAAHIVADHLEDSGYALLCNGAILLEGDGLLVVPPEPQRTGPPRPAAA